MKTHCMVDLETLGTNPGAVIVAIGAVAFTQKEELSRFYTNVSIDSCLEAGLVCDGGALKFWMLETNDQNRKDLFDPQPVTLRDAISAFTKFYQQNDCQYLWSHGSNFDQPVLHAAYTASGHKRWVPWNYRLTRDTRTLFALAGGIQDVVRTTDKHNALADAEFQARCVQAAYGKLGLQMEVS